MSETDFEPKSMWFNIPRFLMFNWISLNDVLNNKLVKSSSIWLVITPVFARIFSNVNTLGFPFLDGKIILSLPFSWVCFFFSALFFSFSSILFGIYCPRSIRNYKNLSDFKDKDFSSAHIKNLYFNDTPRTYPTFKGFKEVSDFFFASWADEAGVGLKKVEVDYKGGIFDIDMIVEGNMQNAFIGLRNVFKETHHFARMLITLSFYLGVFFLLIVLSQNVGFVISQTNDFPDVSIFFDKIMALWPLCITSNAATS